MLIPVQSSSLASLVADILQVSLVSRTPIHSTLVSGVFAGEPYDCARNQSYTTCMYPETPSITIPTANMRSWSANRINPVSNLKSRKIYMWVRSMDTTVRPNVVNQLQAQLASFENPSNTSYITTSGAVHTFPTDFDTHGDSSCSVSLSPYISNCSYDGAAQT